MDLSRMARFTAALMAAALLAGCGGDGGTDPNAPPTATILSPEDGATFTAGESISFEATASDQEDGSLTGSRVVWSSDLDGRLGTGTSLIASLTAGSHTVTVTVTDSDDEQATDAVSVDVAQLASVCSPGDPGVDMDLAVGAHATFSGESAYCLQFGETSSTAEYLIGVQSTASTVSSLTPIRITGDPGAVAGLAADDILRADAPPARAEASTAADPRLLLSDRAQRLRRHRAAESRLREWELENLPFLRSAASGEEMLASSSAALAIPPAVDDTVDLRVVDLTRQTNLCTGYTEVRGVIRLVGENSIWLEDVENPEPGFSLSDLQQLSDLFDQTIHQVDSTWFGAPTDIDQNGRMAVLITKEVNRADEPIASDTSQISRTLGFVFGGDLLGRSQCAASNEGEIYYSRAPDPDTEFGLAAYTVEAAKADAPFVLAHEFVHTIQFGRRSEAILGTGLPRWVSEGQATLAEEVVGWELDGLGPGQDLGLDVAFDQTGIDWYSNAFVDLAVYFGLEPLAGGGFGKVEEAPHECSWLEVEQNGNDGPCHPVRQVYGVPWSLLRWVSDLYGPVYPGGAQALQRDLVVTPGSGYQALETVVGEPIERILAGWAPMLFTDGRAIANLDPRLTLPSWDLWDIFQGLVPQARLVPIDRSFGTFDTELQVRAGSSAYIRLSGASAATAIGVGSPSGADLPATTQVWIVRLQ